MTYLPLIDSCDECGVCCMKHRVPPFTLMDDGIEIVPPGVPGRARILRLLERLEQTDLDNAGTCIWFDAVTKTCRHYDDRPAVCRQFQMGADGCRELRREFRIELGHPQG